MIRSKHLDFYQETLAADAEVEVDSKETALGLLRDFQDDLSRKAFVKHVLSSTESNKTGAMFPWASGSFDDLSDANQENVIAAMSDIAIKVAKVLLPNDTEDGAQTLLQRMQENKSFRQFALPTLDTSNESFEQWIQNPVVGSIKGAQKGKSTMVFEAPATVADQPINRRASHGSWLANWLSHICFG